MRWRTSDRLPIKKLLLTCLLSVSLLFTATSLSAQEFEFDFTPEELYLPIMIDGRYAGEINTLPMDEMTTEVDIQELTDILSNRLSDEKLAYFQAFTEQWVAIDSLQDAPALVSFNMYDLIIEVFIPPENTQSKSLSLLAAEDPLTYPEIVPSDFSMFMNIYANGSLSLGSVDDEFEVEYPVSFIFEPSLNFSGWTLESQLTTSYDEAFSFTHVYSRLIKDWTDLPLRLMLGDITYETATNQVAPSYFGAVITRDMMKSFEQKSYSNYSRSLLVPSDNVLVNIYLNNRRVKVAELNAGMYTIEDFYFNNGVNELSIQMEQGGEELSAEEFLFAYDNSLTAPGSTEYAFGLGFRDRDLTEFPEIFGMQTFGIDDHMSGEYFFQAGMNQQNLGLSTVLATNAGNIKSSLALSRTLDNQIGILSSMNYRHLMPNSEVNRSFSLSGSFTSSHYTSYSNTDTAAEQDEAWKVAGSYGQLFFGSITSSFSGQVSFEQDGTLVNPSISAAFRTRLSREVGLSATYNGTWDDASTFSPSLTVSLSYAPSAVDLFLTADHNFDEDENSFSVSYSPRDYQDSLSLGLGMTNINFEDMLPDTASISADIKHDDFLLDTSFSLKRQDDDIGGTLEFGLDTAFSFADGLIGLSTPINDSFILVAPRVEVPGLVLGVNPSGDDYQGKTDGWGAAVLNGLSSFTEHAVTIEPIEIPVGFEMGADKFTFRPTYHQAGTVKIDVEANVTVIGNMKFSDGSPVALYSGDVQEVGAELGPDEFPEFFFTYTDGTYEIYGLHSGEYVVTLYAGDGLQFKLSIPQGLTGEYHAKDITIPVEYKVF